METPIPIYKTDHHRVIVDMGGASFVVTRGTTVGALEDILEKSPHYKNGWHVTLSDDGKTCDAYEVPSGEDGRPLHQRLVDSLNAGELLDAMRPEIEKILVTAGVFSPPSQTMRVRECIEKLDTQLKELIDSSQETMDPGLNFRQRLHLNRLIRILTEFQAVLVTVRVLEGRTGCGGLQDLLRKI